MAKRKAFNMDFSDLMDDIDNVYSTDGNDSRQISSIDLSLIKPNPYQPREHFDDKKIEELARSIDNYGLIQPVIISPMQEGEGYFIIAGERRYRACRMLDKTHIDSIIVDIEQHSMREVSLIENIQRENLNPIELATCYSKLISEHNFTHEELSLKLGKSRVSITNAIRLLGLGTKTKELIKNGNLSAGHAKILVGLSPEQEEKIVNEILQHNLNVRDVEKIVKNSKQSKGGFTNVANEHMKELLLNLKSKILDSTNGNISIKVSATNITLTFKEQKDILDFMEKWHMQ